MIIRACVKMLVVAGIALASLGAMLADKDSWRAARDAMVPVMDAQYGVYVRDRKDGWTFNMKRFEALVVREGINGCQRTETSKLKMSRKVFEDMSKGWPQLEELRQLRYARDKMRKVKLAVGSDFEIARCYGPAPRSRRTRTLRRFAGAVCPSTIPVVAVRLRARLRFATADARSGALLEQKLDHALGKLIRG